MLLCGGKARVFLGINGGEDVERVFLHGEAVAVCNVAVLHGDEYGNDGRFVAHSQRESAVLHGARLAVVPPHSLLGVNKYRFAARKKCRERLHELFHRRHFAGKRKRVAMAHKKPERGRRVRIVSLAYDLIEHFSAHVGAKRAPYGVVIAYAEMVAGDDLAAFNRREVFNSAHLFYDKPALLYHLFEKARAEDICNFGFDLV